MLPSALKVFISWRTASPVIFKPMLFCLNVLCTFLHFGISMLNKTGTSYCYQKVTLVSFMMFSGIKVIEMFVVDRLVGNHVVRLRCSSFVVAFIVISHRDVQKSGPFHATHL